MTPSPSASSKSRGRLSPPKRRRPYGSSSRTVAPCALAVRLGERPPARVLERGDRVDEARPGRRREPFVERVEVHAVVGERDRLDVGAEPAQDLERAVVAGRLDEDARARLDVVAGDEVERLQGAVRDHDPLDVDVVAVGDPLAQRQVAERRPVVERRGAVAREGGLRAVAELIDRQEIRARNAPGKGDEAHGTSLLTAAGRRVPAGPNRSGLRCEYPAASG